MSDAKKYVKHENSGAVMEIVAETDSHYWLTPEGGRIPRTYNKHFWQPHTPLDPAQVPQVGEMWSYSPDALDPCPWLCIESNPEKGYWRFVHREDLERLSTHFSGRTELTQDVRVFTHPLPETSMKKIS
ncbi:MAG: hypothetical protein ABR585_12775 [Gemmatimonadaceae bacterium]|nr:hypothetical protein [Actinomycetota bacterium]